MGEWIPLDTAAGPVRAWQARPAGAARGAVLVVQEIFGANAHIRSVADGYAEAGFLALAPAMFDPVESGIELDYDTPGMDRGRALAQQLGFDRAIEIVRGGARQLADAGHRCAAIGFCWGGSVALLANTRLGLPAVSYYGGRSIPFLQEPLRAPMLFHFGAEDPLIPPADIARHRQAWPQAALHVYEGAGHAFNRDSQPHDHHFHPPSAALARQRTLAFLAEHTA